MAKKSRPAVGRQLGAESTPAERVTWLLNSVWKGNRSAMGEAVGVSHSVLAKIAAGQQNPGRRLLGAIAGHPKVNPAWLLSGEGAPLLAETPEGPAAGWAIPISYHLLPGPVADHGDMLSDKSFPTAGAHYRPSRYWFEVRGSEKIAKNSRSSILANDLLLFETDPRQWPTTDEVDQHFCVIRLGKERPFIGLVSWFPGDEEEAPVLSADSFEPGVDQSKLVEQITILKHHDGRLEARSRLLEDTGSHGKKPVSTLRLQPIEEQITLDNILAVCMQLLRQF